MKKKFVAMLSVTVLLAVALIPCAAFANSAPSWYEGTSASGVVVTEDCPLEVTGERLTFNIVDYPNWEDFAQTEYLSNVVAEYTFNNPTDLTIDVGLVFPFGRVPEYAKSDIYTDINKYDITVNGAPVEKTLRCTYSSRYSSFDIQTELAKLRDSYVNHYYYNSSLTVYKNTYKVQLPREEAVLVFDVDTDKTRLLGDDDSDWLSWGDVYTFDNAGRVSVKNGEEFTLYFVGENVNVGRSATFWKGSGDYYDYTQEGKTKGKIDGKVELLCSETCTFDDLAFLYYNEATGISRIDWYNAVVDMASSQHLTVSNSISQFDMRMTLMRWYEYQLHVEPYGTITNTVTAPIYPTVDYGYDPSILSYEYLLSPASCWKSFSDLTVVINTDYHLQDSHSITKFKGTDTGYVFHSDTLPERELMFSLCKVEHPKTHTNWFLTALLLGYIALIGGGLLGGGLYLIMLVVAVIIIIVVTVRKKRDKQLKIAAEQQSGAQGELLMPTEARAEDDQEN